MGEVEELKSLQAKLDALCRLGQALILLRDERRIAEAVLEIAEEVLDFGDCDFLLVDEGRQDLYVAARRGGLGEAAVLRLPLDGERGLTVVAARTAEPVYVPDVREDPRYVDTGFDALSELAVPVRVEGRVLGVINVESRRPDGFTATDEQLLSTLASQAALALENARFYARERRRVEEMAAVNEVARRVSASLDLRETLDAIVAAAAELVPCTLAEISLWDEERQLLTLQALRCTPERDFPIGQAYPPGQGYTGWVVRHKEPLLVPDVDACEEIRPDILPGELPFQSYIGLPLMAGEELIGTLVLIHDQAGSFGQADVSLLTALAGQAAVVIRNARLFEEVARRHHEVAALYTVASVINQPLSLQEKMDQAVAMVLEVMQTEAGGIRLLDQTTGELVIVSCRGLSPEYIRNVDRARLGEGIVGRVAQSGEPLVLRDLTNDPRAMAPEAAAAEGFETFAVVPLRSGQQIVGTLAVITRERREFGSQELDLLEAIGHQLGVAIGNARLRQQALDVERLAAVGRVAGTVAHDLRSPLGGIIRSAEFLARSEISAETRQKLSQAIVAMARRLINTAQEIVDFTRGGRMALQLAPCALPEYLEQVLDVFRVDLTDRGIEVVMDWGYVGPVHIDPDRMAQVVFNVASNARDAMPEGGKLQVTSRQVGEWVEIRFADTGPGVPPELAERIFEPFISYGKREGAGLGLSIARRIVQEHGGEILLESPAEGGAAFVVRLPRPGREERSSSLEPGSG